MAHYTLNRFICTFCKRPGRVTGHRILQNMNLENRWPQCSHGDRAGKMSKRKEGWKPGCRILDHEGHFQFLCFHSPFKWKRRQTLGTCSPSQMLRVSPNTECVSRVMLVTFFGLRFVFFSQTSRIKLSLTEFPLASRLPLAGVVWHTTRSSHKSMSRSKKIIQRYKGEI